MGCHVGWPVTGTVRDLLVKISLGNPIDWIVVNTKYLWHVTYKVCYP
jgi:hypothetical protein